jgi:hypothetical protein
MPGWSTPLRELVTLVERIWRPHGLGRAMAWVYIVVFALAVVGGTVLAAVAGEPGLLVVALAGGLPLLMVSVFGALRPYVCASQQGLQVQNPITRVDLSWAEITQVRPGYHGLEITTRDGDVAVAWAVQKSNWARWLKRRTRADDVAAVLEQMAAEH